LVAGEPSYLLPLRWRSAAWKLDRDGLPQWLIVVEVIDPTSYLVRYPDGKTEILVDSE
jgi:hypothetical protein